MERRPAGSGAIQVYKQAQAHAHHTLQTLLHAKKPNVLKHIHKYIAHLGLGWPLVRRTTGHVWFHTAPALSQCWTILILFPQLSLLVHYIACYRETSTYILKGIDDLQQQLDDHIAVTQQLAYSAFKKPFSERIDGCVPGFPFIFAVYMLYLHTCVFGVCFV